jgi:hypothetical protein
MSQIENDGSRFDLVTLFEDLSGFILGNQSVPEYLTHPEFSSAS